MEYSDAEHARAVAIEAALRGVVQATDRGDAFRDDMDEAKRALEPEYVPLVSYMELKNGWQRLHSSDDLRIVGATYLEAAADRMESFGRFAIQDLRDWAKAERAI